MPLLHHDFRRFLDALDVLNPAQIEDARTRIRDLRQKSEAISEIEARTNQDRKCPCCGNHRHQKWRRTRTRIQRYRFGGSQKTYSGRTGSAIGRIHRPDLFMVALGICWAAPRLNRCASSPSSSTSPTNTVWRRRMLVSSITAKSTVAASFSGIIEADKTYQRSRGRDRANGLDTSPIRKISRSDRADGGKTSRRKG
jgi:hypothetical protein